LFPAPAGKGCSGFAPPKQFRPDSAGIICLKYTKNKLFLLFPAETEKHYFKEQDTSELVSLISFQLSGVCYVKG